MKLVLALALLTTLTARAAETFGMIRFDASVPAEQTEALKNDLRYLFDTPVVTPDPQFIGIAELSGPQGPHLHNWIVNRVRHIVGEGFMIFDENHLDFQEGFKFPQSPLPGRGGNARLVGATDNKLLMANDGAVLYLSGKTGVRDGDKIVQMLMGVKFEDKNIWGTSPRVGIIRVGSGLFSDRYKVTENVLAPANTIARMGVLVHEARHSDGNGKSTGFLHTRCPKTHAYANSAACDRMMNGAYMIEALALRSMLNNCSVCSLDEKARLAVITLDAYSRVLSGATNAARIATLRKEIEAQENIVKTFEGQLTAANKESDKKKIRDEIIGLRRMIGLKHKDISELEKELAVVPTVEDPRPEGHYETITLEASQASMNPKVEE